MPSTNLSTPVFIQVLSTSRPKGIDASNPVLLSEPVEWSAEYRCFINEGEIAAWSPYISFGRPAWKPFGKGHFGCRNPGNLESFCKRLFSRSGIVLPPAFVMDIGLIDDRGWGVVEFNPVWCSGVLGADRERFLRFCSVRVMINKV